MSVCISTYWPVSPGYHQLYHIHHEELTKKLYDSRMDDALSIIKMALAGMPGSGILAASHVRRASADRLMITLEFVKELPVPGSTAKSTPRAQHPRAITRRKSPCWQRRAARRVAGAGAAANAAPKAASTCHTATEIGASGHTAQMEVAAKMPPPPQPKHGVNSATKLLASLFC